MASIVHLRSTTDFELLLRETNHRCCNDLQMVVSLLALQSRKATDPGVARDFADVMERVAVLARARRGLHDGHTPSLDVALRELCHALHAQAEPRSIRIGLVSGLPIEGLSGHCITTLVLVVNELATNALKHAFHDRDAGQIVVAVRRNGNRDVVVTIVDDGLPFPDIAPANPGLGLELARRMMASINGMLIAPLQGSKMFELRLPLR